MIPNTTSYAASYTDRKGLHSHLKPVIAWATDTGDALVVDEKRGMLVPARSLYGFHDLTEVPE